MDKTWNQQQDLPEHNSLCDHFHSCLLTGIIETKENRVSVKGEDSDRYPVFLCVNGHF